MRLLVNCNESLFVWVFDQPDKAVKNVYLMSAALLYPLSQPDKSIRSIRNKRIVPKTVSIKLIRLHVENSRTSRQSTTEGDYCYWTRVISTSLVRSWRRQAIVIKYSYLNDWVHQLETDVRCCIYVWGVTNTVLYFLHYTHMHTISSKSGINVSDPWIEVSEDNNRIFVKYM